ncbi:unnamed protein product [Durusdinium trenchii]|uniref:Uncharacterized protein n=1 Tax=Durusdinium trenchii TaxID=1381693 RepID=A0ABP0LGH8_9DINO
MDSSGVITHSQNGNVVLKSRASEAGQAPQFILKAASSYGNRRQSRRAEPHFSGRKSCRTWRVHEQ